MRTKACRCRATLIRAGTGAALLGCLAALRAAAQAPAAPELLAELGLSPKEIEQVEAGELVRYPVPPASERELTAGIAFHVAVSPAQLVNGVEQDLMVRVDPNVTSFGAVSTPGSAADFSKLTVGPERAKAYASARPGDDLHLSAEEIASFQKLGSGAAASAVEAQVRSALLARVQAYRAKGLAGIASYDFGGGKRRSPADELRTATLAAEPLRKYAPAAYQYLLSYPSGEPRETREILRWSQFDAQGKPTIALTHVLIIPDGNAYLVTQRQFYASTGYNAEQAIVAFLPATDGTIVVYANRTSTDQITGFGGGAKRSLGSKVLASELETIFEKARAKVQ